MTESSIPAVVVPEGDITSRADCEKLVRAFYEKALVDPYIGWLFTDVAELDLEEHIPVITSFWETILLDAQTYGGGAFGKHANLNSKATLKPWHFERWLILWIATVDELFAGLKAEEAKEHAKRVARAFYSRIADIQMRERQAREQASAGAPSPLQVNQHGAN